MRVAIIHTRYRQRGGEEAVVEAEAALLERHGHEVHDLAFDNAALPDDAPFRAAAMTLWNGTAYRSVRDACARIKPDVVHVHNTFPAASPAVIVGAAEYPIVHTLHNYRWLCPAATFLRDGRPCEDCLGRLPWPAVVHNCYRERRTASAVVAVALAFHRLRGTLAHVDRFIALSAFARNKLIQGGFPAERVVVKPNFSQPTDPARPSPSAERFALYVGRLSEEKGIRVLAQTWREHPGLPPLEVIGQGPLRSELEGIPRVLLRGEQPHGEVRARLAAAHALVMPSICYEGLPMVLLEAAASGLPVIASDIGSLSELVDPGVTGWRVLPGQPSSLAAAIRVAFAVAPRARSEMSAATRARHARDFSPTVNIEALLSVYDQAVAHHRVERGLNS